MNKWFGFPFRLRLHPLLIIMMAISIMTGYFIELITLFIVVLIHELGHAAAAAGFGWKVHEIRLLPFGGVAIVDDLGLVPAHEELIVALAGPLQNAVMIAFAYGVKQLGIPDASWWDFFIMANMTIGLFNMLPILPLDGGKIVQALLSYVLTYHLTMVATTITALIMSCLMVLFALLPISGTGIQLNLFMVGLFLTYSNWYDYRNIPYRHFRFLMGREGRMPHWLSNGTLAQPIVVQGHRSIGDVLLMFKRERYHLIYVLNEKGAIRGVFPEQIMMDTFFNKKKPGSAVSDLFM